MRKKTIAKKLRARDRIGFNRLHETEINKKKKIKKFENM